MAYWLMKSEPDELSIKDLARLGEARWDGVRNYQARNFLRAMAVGDQFFFYHSSCPEPGIAGIAASVPQPIPTPLHSTRKATTSTPRPTTPRTPGALSMSPMSKPSTRSCNWATSSSKPPLPNWRWYRKAAAFQ